MAPRRTYTDEERAPIVGRAAVVGVTKASEESGVPKQTIDYWLNSPRFGPLRTSARESIADGFWIGVQVALQEVVDGLTNPRAPLRDKAQALKVLYDAHALMSGAATSRTEARDITGTISDAELAAAIREAESIATGGRGPETAEDEAAG